MSTFATMVRKSLARESDAATELGVEPVAPEQVEEVLADPISADIQTEVVAEATDAEVGTAEMETAAATADELGDTAETLEAATADGGEGVDEAAAQMAVAALERCQRAYGIARKVSFAKESFATKTGRKELTLRLAREADGASKTLWARVVETAQNLWAWLKNFVAGLFDKRKRLATRAEALATKADEVIKSGAKPAADAKIGFSGPASVVGGQQVADPLKALDAVPSLVAGLEHAKTLVEATAKDASGVSDSTIDINPQGVGNVALTLKFEGGRVTFNKEAGKATVEAKEISPLTADQVKQASAKAKAALVALGKGEAEVKAAEKAVGGLIGKLKALATGKETSTENKGGTDTKVAHQAERSAILSKLRATSSLTGTIASVSLTVIDASLTVAAKSLAAHKAPEKAKAKA